MSVSLAERALRLGERPVAVVVTRIADFRAEPLVVTPGEVVTVTGRLEEHWPPAVCSWGGVAGEGVDIYINESKAATVTTAEGGGFTFRFAPTELGAYAIKAKYPGTWWRNPCESAEVVVRAVTKEEKEEYEREQFLRNLLFWGGILGVVGTAAGVGLYLYDRERRMRMLEVLAARR